MSSLSFAIRFGVALLALAVLCSVSPARAEDEKARARVLFNQGVAEFEAGEHRAALASFESAYRLAPHPAVRVNMANCYEALGRLVEAVFNYERFLEESGENVSAAQRADVETAIASLAQRIGTLSVALEPSNAVLRIDGEIPKTLPSGAVQLPTGRYDLSVTADGFLDAQRTVVIKGQEETRISIKLEPEPDMAAVAVAEPEPEPVQSVDEEAPPTEQEPAPVEASSSNGLLWAAAGTTAALAVGFAVTGGLALSAQRDFDDAVDASNDPTSTPMQREAARLEGSDAADRADTLALVSDVCLVGSALAGGATLLIWLTSRDDEHKTAMRAGPMVLRRGGGGLVVGGKF